MRDEKQPAVYIVTNKPYGTLYIGVTSALWLRIGDHKNGRSDGFTKKHGLDRLVWYEHHHSMPSAIHREKRLKKWQRAWKFNLINSFNPDWRNLHGEIDGNVNLAEEFASRKVETNDDFPRDRPPLDLPHEAEDDGFGEANMSTNFASSAPHLEDPATYAGPLKDWGHQANPIAGNSKSDGVLLHKGPGGQPEAGLWQCTPGTWPLEIPRDELCHFVSGRATYTHEGGEVIDIVAGTVVLFPAGWKGICTVHDTMRNVYMLS